MSRKALFYCKGDERMIRVIKANPTPDGQKTVYTITGKTADEIPVYPDTANGSRFIDIETGTTRYYDEEGEVWLGGETGNGGEPEPEPEPNNQPEENE